MYETFPYYTQDGINKGSDYECAKNEYGLLDFDNKRFIIKTIPPADDTIVKKTLITFKNNTLGAVVKGDMFTGRSYVDNVYAKGIVFKGTDKELDSYALELMSKGYNIQDFYDYEKDNK
ncbi:MAG: hypothetical protein CMJ25_13025 [Phycisphaerae bacterium]|nr:hypothetical protein [Phycisphaerae bacterium]